MNETKKDDLGQISFKTSDLQKYFPKSYTPKQKLIRQMLKEVRDLRRLCEGYYTRDRSGAYTTATLKAPRRSALK